MCTSPLWRFEATPVLLQSYGAQWNPPGYKNGGYVFSKKRVDLVEWFSTIFKGDLSRLQEIPCGQCLECRLKISKENAQRTVCESMYYKDNYFITLTIDDNLVGDSVKVIHSLNRSTLQEGYYYNLNRDVIKGFNKRLRSWLHDKYGHDNVRIVYCGEYGSKLGRAHWHLNLMNCPIPDLEEIQRVSYCGKFYTYYKSKKLTELWGIGNVVIAPFSPETAAYVARYIIKKQKGQAEEDYQKACALLGLEPMEREFFQMPLRPGLAHQYYCDRADEIYRFDSIVLPGGKQAKPARYFDKLYDLDNPEHFAEIKAKRDKSMSLKRFNIHKNSNASDDVLNSARAYNLAQRLKKLVRKVED